MRGNTPVGTTQTQYQVIWCVLLVALAGFGRSGAPARAQNTQQEMPQETRAELMSEL